MRSVQEIFKSKEYLLDEPEVEKLVEYCEELQDEIVEFKYQKTNNKELATLDMLKEVIKRLQCHRKRTNGARKIWL